MDGTSLATKARCPAAANPNENKFKQDDFVLVPHHYGRGLNERRVLIWAGAFGEQCEGIALRYRARKLAAWYYHPLSFLRSAPGIRYDYVWIELKPGAQYEFELVGSAGDEKVVLAKAELRAKPQDLGEGFNLWYGTCFYQSVDGGALEEAFSLLPLKYRPDVTVFGGDQVYLDTAYTNSGWSLAPGIGVMNFAAISRWSASEIRKKLGRIFSSEYRGNWSEGLRKVLSQGATYFLAGDHEFWNDYPNPPGFLPVLRSRRVRSIWQRLARRLFFAYQLPLKNHYSQFSIGDELSFFLLDTRLSRKTGEDANFADPAALKACVTWLRSLNCPGVLVVPAPLFTRWQFRDRHGFKALAVRWGFGDHSLADTGQYQALVEALNDAQRDILVVGGDVHYSRLARVELNGKRITEVVSSPLSCLPTAVAAPQKTPRVFPDRPTGDVSAEIEYLKAGNPKPGRLGTGTENNFVTLRFTRDKAGVRADVVCWGINQRDERGQLIPEWRQSGDEQIVLRHRGAQPLVTEFAGKDAGVVEDLSG